MRTVSGLLLRKAWGRDAPGWALLVDVILVNVGAVLVIGWIVWYFWRQ